MNAKGYLSKFGGLLVVSIILTGCAKPPTEKISEIQTALAECETMGAAVFAATEQESINQKMAALNSLMEAKKYKKATALADSISMDVTALVSTVETNGKEAAHKVLMDANQQLAALKGMLSDENVALLDTLAAGYKTQCEDGEARVAALEKALEEGNALNVYNSSPIVDQLAATVQACGSDIAVATEQAAAKAAKKSGKKKK